MTTSDSQLLDSFEHHAGSDERIEADQMSEVFGLRTESIAQKVFAIFDENGDGAISREDSIGGVVLRLRRSRARQLPVATARRPDGL